MSDIDRTQVVIETEIDDRKALQKIEKLERQLNSLEGTREVKLTFDSVSKALNQQLQLVNEKINDIFNSKSFNSDSMTSLASYKTNLNTILKEIKPSMTAQELADILDNAHITLDNSTISALADSAGGNTSFREAEAGTVTELRNLVNKFNTRMTKLEAGEGKMGEAQREDLIREVNEIESILKKRYKVGEDQKENNRDRYSLEKVLDVWNKQQEQRVNKENKDSGRSSSFGNIFKALLGVRTLFTFVRRIASQNEMLTTAVNNFMTTVANLLAPILNFLAVIINTIATWLGRLFGVESSTAASSAATASATKQLAGFDEINNIGGDSGGGGGAGGAKRVKVNEDLIQLLNGLLEIAIGVIKLIGVAILELPLVVGQALVGLFSTIVGAVAGLVNGIIEAIKAYIGGLWNTITTLFADIWKVLTGFFTGFIEGFNNARDEGKSILGAIFAGIWEGIKTVVSSVWNLIVDVVKNVWKTISSTFTAFIEGFKTGFNTVKDWFEKTLINPMGELISGLWTKYAKPALELISDGWYKVKNAFRNVMNGVIGFINNVIYGLNKLPGVSIGYLSYMANGGMPQKGSMFIAGEAGPELVGKMGTNSAVMNNDQIVDSVSKGVAAAVSAVLGNGGQDVNIYLDGRVLGSAVVNYINKESRVLGARVV